MIRSPNLQSATLARTARPIYITVCIECPMSLNEASLRMADRLALYPHWQTHRRKWLYFLHFAYFHGRHCAWRQRPDYCVIGDERLPEGSVRPDAVCTGAYRNTFARRRFA